MFFLYIYIRRKLFHTILYIRVKIIEFWIVYKELFPAIRSNLLLFKEKSKRISASIGAMGAVFRRNPEEEGKIPGKREPERKKTQDFRVFPGSKPPNIPVQKVVFCSEKRPKD
ncbi:hypothetical protein [Flavobacterium sp. ASV13]|uniref:hypothetical protein n=1 Tax=Flavobacterium sp. ASV13 TaxID=1506583 RepID=UPI0005577BEB|nr:hypothetical protein [Flavobacterium sp. ASV13]